MRLCSFSGVLLPNTSTLAAFGLLLAGSVLPNARRGFCGARRLDSRLLAIMTVLYPLCRAVSVWEIEGETGMLISAQMMHMFQYAQC